MPEEIVFREKNDSIVVKRNFKGEYGFEIRINYDHSTEEVDDIIEDLNYIDAKLRERFILPSGV